MFAPLDCQCIQEVNGAHEKNCARVMHFPKYLSLLFCVLIEGDVTYLPVQLIFWQIRYTLVHVHAKAAIRPTMDPLVPL